VVGCSSVRIIGTQLKESCRANITNFSWLGPVGPRIWIAIGDSLTERGVKLQLGASVHDPADPMGKLFFNILATFAEFEADLIRMRTREGMAVARAKGKLRGKKPKLSDRQQKELRRMYDTGDYSISDLAELFSISRPTVYRTLGRQAAGSETKAEPT
jgi:DNA invertase Pin-like site-specific DNA recombinase